MVSIGLGRCLEGLGGAAAQVSSDQLRIPLRSKIRDSGSKIGVAGFGMRDSGSGFRHRGDLNSLQPKRLESGSLLLLFLLLYDGQAKS